MRKPSPAMIVALAALFVALSGVGVAASGGNFILGQSNSATTNTALSAPVAGGKALQLTNTDTSNAASTALGLTVAANHAPFTVNTGIKVANLNSDRLDGFDSAAFARAAKPPWTLIGGTTRSDTLTPGKFVCFPDFYAVYDVCWRNFANGTSTAAYTKDAFGFVHLKGVVQCVRGGYTADPNPCEVATPDNVIFVLPTGYRPAETSVFPSASNETATPDKDTFARIDISADGNVVAITGTPTSFMSLDGITFRVA